MIQTLKELVVVGLIAWTVFSLLGPLARKFTSPEDFSRRRNTWFALTVAAFLCPSFWLFCVVAAVVLVPAARRDSNPAALYLSVLWVVPRFTWRVPFPGISYLVDLEFPLLLSLCVMVPPAWRRFRGTTHREPARLEFPDYCLLGYLLLTSVYFVLPEVAPGVLMTPTYTDDLRRACEALLGTFAPYYIISRTRGNERVVEEMIGALCIAGAILAAVGIFETLFHWLLYGEIRGRWGDPYNPYLIRAGSVRAMASTSHSLVLGGVLAVALGLWLSLTAVAESAWFRRSISTLYCLGLVAAYSRGPWIGAIVIYFTYVALSRRALSGLFKAAITAGLVGGFVLLSPIGARIEQVIPALGGTVDMGNITYRERLLARGWELVEASPWLGDQAAISKMSDLRQGEGIVDLMNGFVNLLLDNGFIGLTLFLAFVISGLYDGWTLSRRRFQSTPALAKTGAALVACLVGTMLMMWGGGLAVESTAILVAFAVAAKHCAFAGDAGGPQPVAKVSGA